jgi:LysR family transcriptional regulator, regulator for bpeEF and oprC
MNASTRGNLEVYELNAFVKVAQTGSFTHAGELLDAPKGQVSKAVSSLEAKLGTRLLERTTRSVGVTEAGVQFLERANAILAMLRESQELVQNLGKEPQGTLKLTCGACFGVTVVSTWISQYLSMFPDVDVEAHFTDSPVDIVRDGFDLAVRLGHQPDSSLKSRVLGQLEFGFYASPAYLGDLPPITHPRDLAHHPCLAFNFGRRGERWLVRCGDEVEEVLASNRLRVNSGTAMLEAARNSLGIACLSTVVALADVAQGRIVRVLPRWKLESAPVYAVFPSRDHLPPKVRSFIEHAVLMHGFKTTLAMPIGLDADAKH